jgi:hypothetical protein
MRVSFPSELKGFWPKECRLPKLQKKSRSQGSPALAISGSKVLSTGGLIGESPFLRDEMDVWLLYLDDFHRPQKSVEPVSVFESGFCPRPRPQWLCDALLLVGNIKPALSARNAPSFD